MTLLEAQTARDRAKAVLTSTRAAYAPTDEKTPATATWEDLEKATAALTAANDAVTEAARLDAIAHAEQEARAQKDRNAREAAERAAREAPERKRLEELAKSKQPVVSAEAEQGIADMIKALVKRAAAMSAAIEANVELDREAFKIRQRLGDVPADDYFVAARDSSAPWLRIAMLADEVSRALGSPGLIGKIARVEELAGLREWARKRATDLMK